MQLSGWVEFLSSGIKKESLPFFVTDFGVPFFHIIAFL